LKKTKLNYGLRKKILNGTLNNNTMKSYRRAINKFSLWANDCGIKYVEDIQNPPMLIQKYEEFLKSKGYTPCTIHNYLAPICKGFDISMVAIKKPKRASNCIVKGRNPMANMRSNKEALLDKNRRLVDFQMRVGIRRSELKKLTGKNLVIDESEYLCVEVIKGKGGKYQLQRILPMYIDLISSYFDGTDNRIFSPEEMNNKINLHKYRAYVAKRAYDYYLNICSSDCGKEQLKKEIVSRYVAFNKRYSSSKNPEENLNKFINDMEKNGGKYVLRGETKKNAQSLDLPVEYDRFALMAVSVFHLSHWRLDVTVTNYMISEKSNTNC
jgi:site-specific recombinase XerD